jgi:pyruvate/2-oxoglutarate dehydrogenase complex dihydrolipoamide acyltransferase (E2) component
VTETEPNPGAPRRAVRAAVATAVVVAAVVALAVFQPWKLVVDDVVDEAAPQAAASQPAAPAAPASSAASPAASAPPAAPAPAASPPAAPATRTLATGTFISHEHGTTGTVRLLALADGRRVLRLEGLDTSNGPDLKVWLTDQRVTDGPSGWQVFDDGRYVDLGQLKGNKGNQNYALPAEVRLEGLRSVSIWCDRFNVSFGAAELTAA